MMMTPLTIHSLIDDGARYHGGTGIVSIETDRSESRSTWQNVLDRARRLSSALAKPGFVRGDRAATIAWNNARHLESYFGICSGGFVCHAINPRLFPEQLVYIINHAKGRMIFRNRTFLPIVAALKDDLTTVDSLVLLSGRDEKAAGRLPDTLNIPAREVLMPVVPMFDVRSWGVANAAAMVGAKLVLPGPGLDGECLVRLIDAEGMTETSPLGTANTLLERHAGLSDEKRAKIRENQGRPPCGVELKIVDDAGKRLPEDGKARGNLRIRGHWVVADNFRAEPGAPCETRPKRWNG